MRLVFDCETDGLLATLTKVHSLVIRDLDTGEQWSCTDAEGPADFHKVERGLELLRDADVIYAHNGIDFDIPALQKVYPKWRPTGLVRDTLVLARLRFAHIDDLDFRLSRKGGLPANLIGSHKLEAWGYRLGIFKGSFGKTTDWSQWSPEMQRYCEQDVAVTSALIKHLDKHGGVTDEAVETEHVLTAYLFQQEQNGFPFDEAKAQVLYSQLTSKKSALETELRDTFGSWLQFDYEMTPKRGNKKKGIVEGAAYSKLKRVEFNPSSRQHIARCLTVRYGWQPEEFTDTGQPKVDEDVLGRLPYPEAKRLNEYLLLSKRLGQIGDGKHGWLKHSRHNLTTNLPHIHHRCTSIGAVTHRAAHSNPNLAQVPKVTSPYGTECRSLFRVPPGWQLLGADASGLELRCLAHYMARYDGGAYGRVILEGRNEDGTDIHSVNRDALGLGGKAGRDAAKTFIYAYLYGAGDTKLGSIVRPHDSEEEQAAAGKQLRKAFEKNIPALGRVTGDVKQVAKDRGYVRLIDGRRAYIRAEHAALNTLLQGTGAVICKRWIVEFSRRFEREFGPQGWRGKWAACAWVHDEVQIAVRPDIAERASALVVESIRAMTDHYQFRCALDGEAKLGTDWASTH